MGYGLPHAPAVRQTSRFKQIYLTANLAAVPILAQNFMISAAYAFMAPVASLFDRIAGFLYRTGQTGAKISDFYGYQSIATEIFVYPIVVLLPFLVFAAVRRIPYAEAAGPGKASAAVYAAAAGCSLGLSVLAQYAAELLSWGLAQAGFFEAYASRISVFDGISLALQVVSICVLPALIEEYCYRGVLFAEVSYLAGTAGAVIVSAVFFAVMHGRVMTLPLALSFGLFAGWLRGRYETVGPGILGHFLINLAAVGFQIAYSALPEKLYDQAAAGADILFLIAGVAGALYFAVSHGFDPERFTETYYTGEAPAGQALLCYAAAATSLAFFLASAIQMAYALYPL